MSVARLWFPFMHVEGQGDPKIEPHHQIYITAINNFS